MPQPTCKVDNQGRVTLPAGWRKEHKLRAGSDLVVTVSGPELRLQTRERSLDQAQQIVARHRRNKRSAVERLLKERRQEAALEEKDARHAKSLR
jgi:AbrB family looped-hinge helix DNA binding protein